MLLIPPQVNGEELVEGYSPLERLDRLKPTEASEDVNNLVQLGYNKYPPVGICDLTYQQATLDRFPKEVQNRTEHNMCGKITELCINVFKWLPVGLQGM